MQSAGDPSPQPVRWPAKHAALREHLAWLQANHFQGKQKRLVDAISWPSNSYRKYLSGLDSRGRAQCPVQLRKQYNSIMGDLARANLSVIAMGLMTRLTLPSLPHRLPCRLPCRLPRRLRCRLPDRLAYPLDLLRNVPSLLTSQPQRLPNLPRSLLPSLAPSLPQRLQ